MKVNNLLLLIIFFLVLISSMMPMAHLIDRQRDVIKSDQLLLQEKNKSFHSSKVSELISGKSTFLAGDEFNVAGNVDWADYLREVAGAPATWIWYVPQQKIEVYIKFNPCITRDPVTDACQAETKNISQYKLTAVNNDAFTSGTWKDPEGFETWVYENTQNPSFRGILYHNYTNTNPNEDANILFAKDLTKYNFTVKLPQDLQSLGLIGNVPVYEYYAGEGITSAETNPTFSDGLLLDNTTITLSSQPLFNIITKSPSNGIITPTQNLTLTFEASSGENKVVNAFVDYRISSVDSSLSCTRVANNCTSSLGINVARASDSTDASGLMTFTIGFIFGTAVEETFNFTAEIIFDQLGQELDGPPYFFTENVANSTLFTVDYTLSSGILTQQNVNGNPKFPDVTQMRPGDNFTSSILATDSDTLDVLSGVTLVFALYNGTNADVTSKLQDQSLGMDIILMSPATDLLGIINFRVNTTYSTPLDNYRIEIMGNFSQYVNQTPYYIKSANSFANLSYTFTIANLYDEMQLVYIDTVPVSEEDRPLTNGSIMRVRFRVQVTTDTTYRTYALQYPGANIPVSYVQTNTPVNATLLSQIPGITLGVDNSFQYNGTHALTDSNGDIIFLITSLYPDVYLQKTVDLSLNIDLTENITNNPQTFRFVRAVDQSTVITATKSGLSIDPQYTVLDMVYIGNNMTGLGGTLLLRPGEAVNITYQVQNTNQSNSGVGKVPVNFTLINSNNLFGLNVSVYSNGSDGVWFYTFDDGYIYLIVWSNYGITNETTSSYSITGYVNVSLYNNTNSDQQFYIGTEHQGVNTPTEYHFTYSTLTSAFTLDPQYTEAKPKWVSLTNSGTGDARIRPGNSVNITLQVVEDISGNIITGINFPTNVTFSTTYNDVSIAIADIGVNPLQRPGWYLTDINGEIVFTVTLDYPINPIDSSVLKTEVIFINATVDFENETVITGGSLAERWIVGLTSNSVNLSMSSYSTTLAVERGKVEKRPLYLTAELNYVTNSLNVTKATPADKLQFSYEVTYSSNAISTSEGIAGNPIEGVTVRLNLTDSVFAQNNVIVIGSSTAITDATGRVTFTVNITDDTFLNGTPDGFYSIPAIADFENDSTIVSQINNTLNLRYWWINGTISSLGRTNSTYSLASTGQFEIKRTRVLQTLIANVYDEGGSIVSPGKTARRNHEIGLNLIYKFSNQSRISNIPITIIFQQNLPAGGTENITYINAVTSDLNGEAAINITLDTNLNYLVGDIGILAIDSAFISGGGDLLSSFDNLTVVTNLSLVISSIDIELNSNEAFIGENLAINGTIHDDLNQFNTNNYLSVIQNEIQGIVNIFGTDIGNNVVGTNVSATLTFKTTGTYFTAIWQIPDNFIGANLTLHVNINETATHFAPLPLTSVFQTIPVYQSISTYTLNISPSDNGTNLILPDQVIMVNGSTGPLSLTGQLIDNHSRGIANRTIKVYLNGTVHALNVTDNNGNFVLASLDDIFAIYQSEGFYNSTFNLTLVHVLPNGTEISSFIYIIHRIVYDTTSPTITLNTPIPSYVYFDLNLNYTLIDPISNAVFTGLNLSTLVLYQNNSVIWNNTVNSIPLDGNGNLIIQWNFSSISNAITQVNLLLEISDNASNQQQYLVFLNFDRLSPIINSVSPQNNTYAFGTNFLFEINASDNQSGLNTTSGILTYNAQNYTLLWAAGNLTNSELDFSNIQTDISVNISIKDLAGNEIVFTVNLKTDSVSPTVTLNTESSTPHNSYSIGIITIVFNVIDSQTGINQTSAAVYKNNVSTPSIIPIFTSTNGTNEGYFTINDTINPGLLSDLIYTLEITDNNNNQNSSTFIIKADRIKPNSQFITPIFGSRQDSSQFIITLDLWDNESGINTSSISVFSTTGQTKELLDISLSDQTSLGNNVTIYTFEITIKRIDLILTQQQQNINVDFTDMNLNSNETTFTFETDITAPILVTKGLEYTDESMHEDLGHNLTEHVITFEFTDIQSGFLSSSINFQTSVITLSINSITQTIPLDTNNDEFRINIEGNSIIITWSVTLESIGLEKGDIAEIVWTISGLEDSAGNQSSPPESHTYILTTPPPPPPFDWVQFFVTGIAAFGIFIFVGIGSAFLYERWRYE